MKLVNPLSLLIMIVCIALFGGFSCTLGREKVVIKSILVDRLVSPLSATQLPQREEIYKAAVMALKHRPGFMFEPDSSAGNVLRVGVAPSSDPRVKLSLTLFSGADGGGNHYFAETDVDLRGLQEGIENVLGKLETSGVREKEPTVALVETIQRYLIDRSVERNTVAQAIKVLGARQEKESIAVLTKLLLAPNEVLALVALTSLAQIGDQSSVSAVIEFAERKPPEIRKQAILAVERMGGKEGAAWLFTLSTGHTDDTVREVASAALVKVESRMNKAISQK